MTRMRMWLLLAALGMVGLANGADFKVGDCSVVRPNSLPEPRGGFLVGKIGKVTDFMVWDKPASLKEARKTLGVTLHFMDEPADMIGWGQVYRPEQIRRVKCPKDFTLKPYGFELQPLLDVAEKVLKLVDGAAEAPRLVTCWQSTAETHCGRPIDAESARAWVEQMNAKYPSIYHWTEAAR